MDNPHGAILNSELASDSGSRSRSQASGFRAQSLVREGRGGGEGRGGEEGRGEGRGGEPV